MGPLLVQILSSPERSSCFYSCPTSSPFPIPEPCFWNISHQNVTSLFKIIQWFPTVFRILPIFLPSEISMSWFMPTSPNLTLWLHSHYPPMALLISTSGPSYLQFCLDTDCHLLTPSQNRRLLIFLNLENKSPASLFKVFPSAFSTTAHSWLSS